MERVKSNVGKGFGRENPINLMDAGCQMRLGEGIWMGKSYKLHGFGWGNPTNYIHVGCHWTNRNSWMGRFGMSQWM